MEQLRNPLPTLTAREKYVGAFYLFFHLFCLGSLFKWFNQLLPHPLDSGLLNFLYLSVSAIAILTIFSRFMKKNLLRTMRFPKETCLYALAGLGLYLLASGIINLAIQKLFQDYVNLNDSTIWALLDRSPFFMVLSTIFLAPVVEEILHRGLVFGSLYAKSPMGAYILSALLFAAIHLPSNFSAYPSGYWLVALIQYLPAGLIFAWSYQHSGSIFTPILIHAMNNSLLLISAR